MGALSSLWSHIANPIKQATGVPLGSPQVSKALYDMFCFVFGNGVISTIVGTNDKPGIMLYTLDAASKLFTSGVIQGHMAMFIGIGDSLVVIFFLVHAIETASNDMLTLEKFTLLFAKLVVGLCLVTYIGDIIPGLFDLMKSVFNMVNGHFNTAESTSVIKIFGSDKGAPEWNDTIADEFVKMYGDSLIGSTIGQLPGILVLLIPCLVGWVAIAFATFLSLSTSIRLIIYAIFAPVAVTQCFEPGSRNQGVRYLKKFAATGLTFSIYIIAIWAANQLSLSILSSVNEAVGQTGIDATNFPNIVSFKSLGLLSLMTVIQFGGIGAMASGKQLASDIMGV